MEPGAHNHSEIGTFEFIHKLGKGGFGEVWLASDPNRDEKVAVKFLNLEHSTPGDIEVFKREFEILSELKQVHLARVFDFGYSPEKEQYFLSTEFCPGKKLLEAIDGKDVAYFEEILVQLLTALECIHSQGIIHFDIKPENVLVEDIDGSPQVKLVDFGVAVRLQAMPEQLGGTLAFVAPEVIERSSKLDHRVDLYSLGMMCLFCLTKRLPFIPGNPQDVIDWHRTGGLRDHIWKGRAVPNYLREITEKLLAKNPSERFSNARVVLNFLNLATGGKYRQAEEDLPAQVPIEGPLVERREEILRPLQERRLQALSSRAPVSDLSVQFICGERGIGKSRILDEIRHFIQLKEIPLLKIDCDWNVPTWPKLEKWLGTPALASDELNQSWQTRRRMDAILETAKKEPICLLIDDFHKADQEMKDLISALAERTQGMRKSGQGPPLFILLSTEEEIEGAESLKRLSPAGISQYLQLVLGETIPIEHLADVLFQYSGGLPLLMVEGLRFLAPYFFRGESLENLLRPEKIHLLYEDKIKRLTAEEEELLLVVALLFRQVSETELNNILNLSAAQLIARANNCFKMGLLSGNLYGEAIFRVSSQALALDLIGGLKEEKRKALHRKIARGLVRQSEVPLQEMAYHCAKAGEKDEAVGYYREAAAALEKAGKISSACDCLMRAAELTEPGSSEWRELSLKAFRLLVLSGNFREAEKYPQILESHPSWEREETEGWLNFKMRRFPQAREKYAEALRMLPDSNALHRILIENALGNIDLQEGHFPEAASRFRRTFESERELSEEERHQINNNNLGLSLAMLGEHEQAVEFFQVKLRGTEKITEKLALLNGLGFACLKASRYEDTISYLKQAMTLAESSGALHALFSVMGNLLTALLKENRYVEALSILKKIDSYQRRFGTRKDIAHNLLRQGSVYLMLGMGEFALGCFQEGLKFSRELGETLLIGWFLLMTAYWERDFGGAQKAEENFHQAEAEGSKAEHEELPALAQYGLADLFYDQGKLEKSRGNFEAIRFASQDHEFGIRLRLLRAKTLSPGDPQPLFSELEQECLKNQYKELLWEVYHAWGKSCLKRSAREDGLKFLEKGIQVLEGIAAALPEEYRSRYLKQAARKIVFEDRDKLRRSLKGGFFNRIKNVFPSKI